MSSDLIRSGKQPRDDPALWAICLQAGEGLAATATYGGDALHGPTLLWAIAGLESDWGRQRLFVRHEAEFMPSGKYGRAEHLRRLWDEYGILAASSLGTWQVMAVTAWELGFRGHPIELQQDAACATWAAKLIAQRIVKRQGAQTLERVLDAYNTGTHRDRAIPRAYIDQGIVFYQATKWWPPQET